MFKHYIKFAFRSLLRDKVFSLINILGLTIGLTGVFVVSIYLINELSFDQFHKNKDRIFRINTEWLDWDYQTAQCPSILPDLFIEEIPEIECTTKLLRKRIKVVIGENSFYEYFKFTTNSYFTIFDFPIKSGDKLNPLKDPNDVVISESIAIKLFDSTNIIGNTFNIEHEGKQMQLKVSAIMDDIPWNSSLRDNIIGNYESLNDTSSYVTNRWDGNMSSNYFLLKENANIDELKAKILNYKSDQIPEKIHHKYHIQSLHDFHLHSSFLSNNWTKRGSFKQLKLFITVGILLLLIAASNYIILSTAKSINRIREISLRKIMGASKKSIIKQISWESVLFCLIIIPLGIIITIIILPFASTIIGTTVEFHNSNILNYIISIASVFLFLILFSGTFIAQFTSKFKPLDTFRGTVSINQKFVGRKVMITLQLFVFITLVTYVLVVQKQIYYSKNMDLGFKKENLFILSPPSNNYSKQHAFLNELKTNPRISHAAYTSSGPPSFTFTQYNINIDNNPATKIHVEFLAVNYNFIETMEFELIEGRTFESNGSDNPDNVCIISESLIKRYDFKNPLGRTIGGKKVIGVVKDFHLHSTKYEVKPMVLNLSEQYLNYLFLRIPSEFNEEISTSIENTWNEFYPNKTFRLRSFSNNQDRAYKDDTEFARNLTIFSSLAIFLSIMGLFGLTLFTIEKRSKEIGIRKIHGASINNIMMMINKEFAILVGIATIISWPVAWYFMDKWLQNFAYTISFPFELYIFSGLVALFIVLLTVSIRSLKAALSNPVDTIRYE